MQYVFVIIDCALLAVMLTVGNPFANFELPPSFVMHGSPFTLFFLFLMQAAFSYRRRLVLWCGLCIVLARTGMLLWTVNQAGAFTNIDLPERTPKAIVEAFLDPNYVHLGFWFIEVVACLIVAGGLAVVVGRSRTAGREPLACRARKGQPFPILLSECGRSPQQIERGARRRAGARRCRSLC